MPPLGQDYYEQAKELTAMKNTEAYFWLKEIGRKTCLQAFLDEVEIPQVFSLWVVQRAYTTTGYVDTERPSAQSLSCLLS